MHGRADVQKQDYFNVSKTFDNLPHQVWEHQWAYLGSAKGPAVVLGELKKSTRSISVASRIHAALQSLLGVHQCSTATLKLLSQ